MPSKQQRIPKDAFTRSFKNKIKEFWNPWSIHFNKDPFSIKRPNDQLLEDFSYIKEHYQDHRNAERAFSFEMGVDSSWSGTKEDFKIA